MSRRFDGGLLLIAAALVGHFGCRNARESPVDNDARPSASPGSVVLTSAMQESIGLRLAKVGRRDVRERLAATGWLMTKPGNEVVVKASATGYVVPADEMKIAELGSIVASRQEIARLHIFASPQEEAQLVAIKEDADTIIEQSLASLAIAEDRYDKLKKLRGSPIAGKELVVLQEAVKRSRAAVDEARDKLPFLPPEPYERPLRLSDATVETPLAGIVTQVHVRQRQFVVQGDPLWTISDWSTLWVRVPVFEGDLRFVDRSETIELTGAGLSIRARATPVNFRQPTEIGRRTVDLIYQIENDDLLLRPGQSVSTALPTGASSEQLVVSPSAILWDVLGNSSVYVQVERGRFRRQRIQVGPVRDDFVVVERGLEQGQQVVVAGAEALYGEEFKSQAEAGDDD